MLLLAKGFYSRPWSPLAPSARTAPSAPAHQLMQTQTQTQAQTQAQPLPAAARRARALEGVGRVTRTGTGVWQPKPAERESKVALCEGKPTASYHTVLTDSCSCQLPSDAAGRLLPTADCRLPTADCRLPALPSRRHTGISARPTSRQAGRQGTVLPYRRGSARRQPSQFLWYVTPTRAEFAKRQNTGTPEHRNTESYPLCPSVRIRVELVLPTTFRRPTTDGLLSTYCDVYPTGGPFSRTYPEYRRSPLPPPASAKAEQAVQYYSTW
ncbi:hypothetical protein CALCODRAFT_198340 [Calocera cornea HHB12733]|uniref:Uncharacterized protein n=1 Tax=Calocera cornea HHB12733 TaxID=1353952 RepID=A0A165HFG3_9BASI|nr:hypothetical protein CALCODRAFT_198340 [Calocera cornea HHB12733]